MLRRKLFLWFINPLYKQGNEVCEVSVFYASQMLLMKRILLHLIGHLGCATPGCLLFSLQSFSDLFGLYKDFEILTVSFQSFACFMAVQNNSKPLIFNPFSLFTLAHLN